MSSRDAIDARVREFVADLEKLIRAAALEAVQESLGVSAPAAKAAPARKAPVAKPATAPKASAEKAPAAKAAPAAATGGKRKKGQKRSPAELAALQSKLDGFVNANAGKRIEEIGKALSIATSELTRPMKKLLEDGKLRAVGQRRATRYYPAKKK